VAKGEAMRYGNQTHVSIALKNAIGNDWKRVLAGNAYSAICRHPEWDGQAISFRFIPIVEDEETIGIRVESYFDTEEEE
jgi:hypothetical protein